MTRPIPYGRQEILDADEEAVVSVLRSDFLTQGPAVAAFEADVAKKVGAAHAIACNSATSALHIACLALGLGPGDRLWTTPMSFVASANCGLYCGAQLSFVDVNPVSGLMCGDALGEKLEKAARDGCLPQVLVVVHLAGHVADMAGIAEQARRFDVKIIEDASHAIGASRDGMIVGDCTYSDLVVFSFHPVKIITAAEGGVATTQNSQIATRMADLRSHGITRDHARFREPSPGDWYYEQQTLGLNYRLSDLHAALGRSQLKRLDDYVKRRAELAQRYRESLCRASLVEPDEAVQSAWHLAIVHCGSAARRADLFSSLRTEGVGVNVHYIPIYRQPFYRDLGFDPIDYPGTESFYADILSLPLFPLLEEKDQDFVIGHVNSSLSA